MDECQFVFLLFYLVLAPCYLVIAVFVVIEKKLTLTFIQIDYLLSAYTLAPSSSNHQLVPNFFEVFLVSLVSAVKVGCLFACLLKIAKSFGNVDLTEINVWSGREYSLYQGPTELIKSVTTTDWTTR